MCWNVTVNKVSNFPIKFEPSEHLHSWPKESSNSHLNCITGKILRILIDFRTNHDYSKALELKTSLHVLGYLTQL